MPALDREGRAWLDRLNRLLVLGIPAGVARSVVDLGASSAIAEEALAASGVLRGGFEAVGDLAIDGRIGRGIASDVLREYDLVAADAGELFSATVSVVTLLDDPESTVDDRLSVLHRVMDMLARARGRLSKEVEEAGLVAVVGLLLAMAGLYPAFLPLLTEPEPGPELVEANRRLDAIGRELRADAAESRQARERDLRLRYVHGPSALRSAPDRKAMRIRTVFPDQLVEIRDVDGTWALVAVFDYRTDQEIVGWIARRNLHLRPD